MMIVSTYTEAHPRFGEQISQINHDAEIVFGRGRSEGLIVTPSDLGGCAMAATFEGSTLLVAGIQEPARFGGGIAVITHEQPDYLDSTHTCMEAGCTFSRITPRGELYAATPDGKWVTNEELDVDAAIFELVDGLQKLRTGDPTQDPAGVGTMSEDARRIAKVYADNIPPAGTRPWPQVWHPALTYALQKSLAGFRPKPF